MGLFRRSSEEPSSQKPDWPEINDLVWIRLPCCDSAVHPSRVEDLKGANLVLAEPSKPHLEPVAPPERLFMIGWQVGTATKQARVRLVANATGAVPTWTVEAVAAPESVQRRRYVRAALDREIALHLPAVTHHGKLLDISEGGLRASIPRIREPRGLFQVSFEVAGEPLMLDVTVAWWGEAGGDTIQVGLEFTGHDAFAEKLRAYAYDLQLEGRRSPPE